MALYRLTFLLPTILALGVEPGRHCPCLHGCTLVIERNGLVRIEGPTRDQVFEQARRFLRFAAKGHGPLSISSVLTTPVEARGRDGWSIIVGAEIAFSPTSLDPDLGPPAEPASAEQAG